MAASILAVDDSASMRQMTLLNCAGTSYDGRVAAAWLLGPLDPGRSPGTARKVIG